MCTPAPACKAALAQATALWPNRNRASDGICGDARHQARVSDHNEGNAFDLTHDPAGGCDAHRLVQGLVDRRDPRVKYVISNGRIWNPNVSPDWRAYSGENPHTKHAHVSIHATARDDTSTWFPINDQEDWDMATADEVLAAANATKDAVYAVKAHLEGVITTVQANLKGELDALRRGIVAAVEAADRDGASGDDVVRALRDALDRGVT